MQESSTEIATLRRDLDTLRRRLHATLAIMLCALLCSLAKPADEELSVRRLAVTDADGKERLQLLVDDVGPQLKLIDRAGKLDVLLGATPENTGLIVYYGNETPAILAARSKDDDDAAFAVRAPRDANGVVAFANDSAGAGIVLMGGEGRPRAQFVLQKDGLAELGMSDSKGERRLTASATEEGEAHVVLHGTKPNEYAVKIHATPTRRGVRVRTDEGDKSVAFGVGDHGEVGLDLNRRDDVAGALGIDSSGDCALTIADKKGKPVFKAP